MSESRPFLFGKLPAFGDFVSRGLGWGARDAWDRRCAETLATTRASAGEGFGRVLEETPPRGFLIAPDGAETDWQAGCAAFSHDRAGRPYLFVLGVLGGRSLQDEGDTIAAHLEPCVYEAILGQPDPSSILDAAVDALGAPDHPLPASWTVMHGWRSDWAQA